MIDVTIAIPPPRSLRRIMTSVAAASLGVQVCSFASSIALARVLGASAGTDAYYLGLAVPALTYGITMAALQLGAIPPLTEVGVSSGTKGLEKAGGELFSGAIVATALLTVLVTGAVELLLPLITSGAVLHATRTTLLELAPYAVLGAGIGVLGAILAVRGVFVPTVAVVAIEPIAKTGLTFGLGHEIGIQSLIAGNLIGGALALIVLWLVVRKGGVRLRPCRPFRSLFVRQTLRLSVPLLVGQSVLVVNPIIDRAMATGFGAGSITALELGLRLFMVPAGLMTGLLIAPIAATWASRQATGGWSALRQSATRAINGAIAIVPPLVILGIVLRNQLVELVFRGGAYPEEALDKTAAVFGMIILGLPAQILIVMLASLFIVQKHTLFPMKIAFANVTLNLLLNLVLRAVFGLPGIALSTSLTLTILVVAYAIGAYRRWGRFYDGSALSAVGRVAASAALTAVGCMLVFSALPSGSSRSGALLVIGVVATVGLFLHGTVLALGRDPFALGATARFRRLTPGSPS